MSADEAAKILGANRYKVKNGEVNTVLFQYGQDGGGSIRISNLDTDYTPYFSGIGYEPRVYKTQGGTSTWGQTDSFVSGGYNYVDSYLFTSDQTLGTQYKENKFNNVNIKFTVKDGKVTNPEVWVGNLQSEGLTSKN